MTFAEWLHAQVVNDPAKEQPYSRLYSFGKYFHIAFGADSPDPVAFKAHLSLEGHDDDSQYELLRQLIIADATWRTDDLEAFASAPEPAIDKEEPVDSESSPVQPKSTAVAKTLRAVKCGFRDLDGTTCTSYSVDGAARCKDHGGAITDPAVRVSLLLLAYAQLTKGTSTAVTTLIDVMEKSTNDLARVNAAKELLDRAGLSPEQHVTVTQGANAANESRADVLDRIKAHLDVTRDRLLPPPPSDDDIVDAEIVDDASAA